MNSRLGLADSYQGSDQDMNYEHLRKVASDLHRIKKD